MELTYWKADKSTSAEIIRLLKERQKVFKDGDAMAKRVGADRGGVYSTNTIFGTTRIGGFTFKERPDPEHWVRLKNTHDGWRPRARSPLNDEMAGIESTALAQIHNLIAMDMIGGGLSSRRAGINPVNGIVYLTVPGDVIPKGCKRITDVVFERATSSKKTSSVPA